VNPCRLGDVGTDAARVHTGGTDWYAAEFQFLAQGFGVATYGKFGGVIGALARNRHEAEQAGQIDDVAITGSLQMGEECLGAVHHTPEVDAHDPFEIVVTGPFDRGAMGNAGIVENQVAFTVVAYDLICPDINLLTLGHIDTGS